jgi:CSLREA domain-containing protein
MTHNNAAHSSLVFPWLVAGVLVLGLILSITPASVVYAATFTVDDTGDAVDAQPGNGVCATAEGACTLRAAIQEANALAGDDVIILPPGMYTLSIAGMDERLAAQGDLNITGNLTLSGAGAESTIIHGGRLDGVLEIGSGITVTISDVTITGGYLPRSGGGIANAGNLTLIDCVVTDNAVTLSNHGGGILNAGKLQLTNSQVISNTAAGEGGGIYNVSPSSAVTLTASLIMSNTSQSCAGLSNNSGRVNLIDSDVIGNTGGGLCNYQFMGPGHLSLLRSTVRGNAIPGSFGGGVRNLSVMTVSRSLFLDNRADVGGAIVSTGVMTLTNTTLSGNSATSHGGALLLDDQPVYLHNTTIVGNVADSDDNGSGDGGGIFLGIGSLTFQNTLVAANVDRGGERPDCRGTLTSRGYNLIQNPAGAGVHTGSVYVGVVGAEGITDITAMGDAMNTAARLVSQAGPGEAIISEATYAAAGLGAGDLERRHLALKGRRQQVDVRVLCVGAKA